MARTIGIDIGTTSTVGVLIDTASHRLLATARRESDLISAQPGWAEEDAEQWWRNSCAVIGELLQVTDTPAGTVAALGVTGMVPALVALDEGGALLRRSIQQNDARTGRELDEMAGEMDGERFFALTGGSLNQQLIGPKLRWLERHEPKLFGRIATVFGSYDFIVWRLTGHRGVEHNWALESGLINVASGAYEADLLALGHAAPNILPPIHRSHEVVGAVTADAARATGLAAGTPVVAGCADHVASAYVAGVVDDGDLLLKFGGAGDILLATDHPRPEPRLFIDYHIVPELFLTNGCMAASGSVLKWIAREFAGSMAGAAAAAGESVYARLDRAAEDVPPGAENIILLPYFLGEKTPLHDPYARGTVVGLGLHHGLPHIWRAALEAVVFGFRHHLEVFEATGLEARRVVASNGGTVSALWLQIAADALKMPVQSIENHPGSCLGAAYVAAMGVGVEQAWDGIAQYVAPGRRFIPDPAAGAAYDHIYPLFRETYERLKPLYPKLSRGD